MDFRRNQVTIQAAYSKNKRTRVVPLNEPAREAFLPLKATATGPYVFSKRDGTAYRSVRTVFEKACKAAGLLDVTPHVLRHTFASRLAMAGVDVRTIQELGGWATLRMVQRYAHLRPGHKADADKKLAAFSNMFHNRPEQAGLAAAG